MIQAEDRAHRIGQNNIVNITYFLADGCIDELLWPLVRQKMKTLGEIVEGRDDTDLTLTKTEDDIESSKVKNKTDVKDEKELTGGDENIKSSVHIDDLEGRLNYACDIFSIFLYCCSCCSRFSSFLRRCKDFQYKGGSRRRRRWYTFQ